MSPEGASLPWCGGGPGYKGPAFTKLQSVISQEDYKASDYYIIGCGKTRLCGVNFLFYRGRDARYRTPPPRTARAAFPHQLSDCKAHGGNPVPESWVEPPSTA